MSGDDKDGVFGIAQEGYVGGVYSPEGYAPLVRRGSHKSTAGHQPIKDQAPEVIVIKTEPKNPPTER